jgi:multiple sugar transport system substrate-binding protein
LARLNKSLFDAAGLPYPPAKAEQAWTWDKFIQVAKKLTKDRNGNDATSPKFDPTKIEAYGLSLPQDWWGYLTFIYSNGGKFVNDQGTELLLNRPEDVEVLQALQDAIFVYHIAPTPTQNKALPSQAIADPGEESPITSGFRSLLVLFSSRVKVQIIVTL